MNPVQPIPNADSFAEIKKFLGKILRRWHWFIIALFWSLLIAFLIIRYETPEYVIKASIITKRFEESSSQLIPGIVGEEIFRNRIEVYQEIPLLRSYDKISETIRRLDFDVSCFVEGNIKTTEIYRNYQFAIKIDSISGNIPYGIPIYIYEQNPSGYSLSTGQEYQPDEKVKDIYEYGKYIVFRGMKLKIDRNNEPLIKDYRYYFIINRPEGLVSFYRSKMAIKWQQQGSAILDISIQTPTPEKDIEFVKKYIEVVIEKGLEEKNAQANNTLAFIENQMQQVSDSMFTSLVSIDNFKLDNRELIDGSSYVFEKLNEMDREKAEYLLANRYYNYLEQYIRQKKGEEVFAPSLIGLDAPLLDELVKEYITLKMEDQLDKNEDNSKNPLVIREHERISRLEKNIFENIRNLKESNREIIREIDDKITFFSGSLKDLQVGSRELIRLEKYYAMNENLYTLLLDRHTEASIARASTTSDYQIVEHPSYNNLPIYPDKENIYLIALAFGFGIPLGLIYLADILNNKVISKDDLERSTNIPLIGHIGHSPLKTNLVIKESPKSLIAESFRTIRANLQYFIGSRDKKCNVFMVSSSISDEGKTFTAINLAYIFALSGKKTLILGADLRKPSLASYFGMREHPGLSNYLAGFNTLQEVMIDFETENLKVILAGDIPPNPAELLGTDKMTELIDYLKKEFDYIIFDTPPIGLVSDAFELLKFTDFNLLVVRQGRTIKSALSSVNELYVAGKIERIGILFNDVDFRKLDYGYGYGYGYSYRYGYYYRYGYGYGYGYFDEEKKPKGGIFRRIRTQRRNDKNGKPV